MSERSINENLDSLMKLMVNDDTELDDFIAKVKPMFETMNANAKKDYSDFVNKWKEEHPDTEPPKGGKEPQKKEDPENPELKSLLERIAVLEKDKAENEKKATIAQKRKDVVAKLKEKGVKDEEWLNDFLSEVNIGDDFDVDAKAESWLKLYNKSKANGGNSVPPANPSGGGSNEYLNSIKAAADIAKRERAVIENK